jgi:hypothetical protein
MQIRKLIIQKEWKARAIDIYEAPSCKGLDWKTVWSPRTHGLVLHMPPVPPKTGGWGLDMDKT